MTKDVSRLKYKEAQALYNDESAPKEDRAAAKDRMDSIRAWLQAKKDSGETTTPRRSGGDRRAIEEKDFAGLPATLATKIFKDTEELLAAQLCRIYHIEKGLADRGIAGNGPFVGMLYNNQVATN
jgi:hypothetical protein